jgi:Tfp pilus assembly protein PilN
MSAIDHFRQTIRTLCTAVEDEAIENQIYWKIILDSGIISLSDLKQRVEDAQADPQKRAETHKMYSEMWKALEETGTDAFFEDLLKDLPPTDKPN